MTYPYNNESESAWDFAAQAIITYGYSSLDYYNGEKFQFLGARKFSKSFLIETFAGFHSLNITSTDSSDVLPVGGMRVYFILPDSLETIFSGSYDYIYLDLMQPRGISDKIAATALNADISYHWSENWKSQIRYESKFLTDSNQKMYVDFSTMYGIYNDTPWLWVGIGGEDTEFKNQVTGYWAPEQFVTFGVRLDSVFPLFGNFSGSFGFNGNELYDKGTDSWGNGYYLSAKLQYGDRNAPNASLFLIIHYQCKMIINGVPIKWELI